MDWTNPCGGRRWRELGTGLFEIEGSGVEYARPSELAALRNCWQNWRAPVEAASERYGIPIAWILAIMVVETGSWSDRPDTQARLVSSAGAIGLMQVMPITARHLGFSPDQMYDPPTNIAAGVKLMAEWRAQGLDLPQITARYNSGGLCQTGRNVFNLRTASPGGIPYSQMAMQVNNSAIALGIGGEVRSSSSKMAVGAALLLGGATLVYQATR